MIKKLLIILFIAPFLFGLLLMDAHLIRGLSDGKISLTSSYFDPQQSKEYNDLQKSTLVVDKNSSQQDKIIAGIVIIISFSFTVGLLTIIISVIRHPSIQATLSQDRQTNP